MGRTKAELEWENSTSGFTTEYFSLDLANLEKAMACVPVHKQLEIQNISAEAVDQFDLEADSALKIYRSSMAVSEDADEINSKILAALKLSSQKEQKTDKAKSESPLKVTEPVPTVSPSLGQIDSESQNLEDWLD